jgi:hypothetical protein
MPGKSTAPHKGDVLKEKSGALSFMQRFYSNYNVVSSADLIYASATFIVHSCFNFAPPQQPAHVPEV